MEQDLDGASELSPARHLCRDRILLEDTMSDSVYKTVDIVGSSSKGIEDAVDGAVARAAKTVKNIS